MGDVFLVYFRNAVKLWGAWVAVAAVEVCINAC